MKNWKIVPYNSTVARFVQCYWFLEKEPHDGGNHYPKLNPDPSGTLILSPSNQPYLYKNLLNSFKGVGNHWIFPNSQMLELDHSNPFTIIGIKFHIGALYSLDIPPKRPVIDEIHSADVVTMLKVEQFNEGKLIQLAQINPQDCIEALDDLLFNWLSKFKLNKHSELCRRAVPLLNNSVIAKLGGELHCSQRTVERIFSRATGFTLKQCQSMNKLEKMLEHLSQLDEAAIDWLRIVDEFDFSDQPHLIRYLKSFIGLTPNEYANERHLTIDIYGNFESS